VTSGVPNTYLDQFVFEDGGTFYVFYGLDNFAVSETYVGYATASTITGTYTQIESATSDWAGWVASLKSQLSLTELSIEGCSVLVIKTGYWRIVFDVFTEEQPPANGTVGDYYYGLYYSDTTNSGSTWSAPTAMSSPWFDSTNTSVLRNGNRIYASQVATTAGNSLATAGGITAHTGAGTANGSSTATGVGTTGSTILTATGTINASSTASAITQIPVVITSNPPAHYTILDGGNGQISITAVGEATITYQWQISTDGGATYSPLSDGGYYSGTGTNTLHFTGVPATIANFEFNCLATNPVNNALSASTIISIAIQSTGTSNASSTASAVGTTGGNTRTATFTIQGISTATAGGSQQGGVQTATFSITGSSTANAGSQTSGQCPYINPMDVSYDYLGFDNLQTVSYWSRTSDSAYNQPVNATALKRADTKVYLESDAVELRTLTATWNIWERSLPVIPKRGDKFSACGISGVQTWIVEEVEYLDWTSRFRLQCYQSQMQD
jgi:hypothetical protein